MGDLRICVSVRLAFLTLIASGCAGPAGFRREVTANGPQCVVSETCLAHISNDLQLPNPEQITPSPDARHLAYATRSNGRITVVLDGVVGSDYKRVRDLRFSPDSKRLGYCAVGGGKHSEMVVVDGREYGRYDQVGPPVFSPDSKRIAFAARRGEQFCWIIDGRETPFYDDLTGFAFSSDGRHVAYGVSSGDRDFIVLDDQPQKPYVFLGRSDPVFSPDGRHLAYIAGDVRLRKELWGAVFRPSRDEQTMFAVIDGVESRRFGNVYLPEFSPDGKHMAYTGVVQMPAFPAFLDAECSISLDGVEHVVQGEVRPQMAFSHDGSRLAYIQVSHWKQRAVVDGAPDTHEFVTLPVFSADSRHVAYAALDGSEGCTVVDGKRMGSYPCDFGGTHLHSPVFSPDGKHVAAVVLDSIVMVDGVAHKPTARMGIVSDIVFDSNDRFHYVEERVNGDGVDFFLVQEQVAIN